MSEPTSRAAEPAYLAELAAARGDAAAQARALYQHVRDLQAGRLDSTHAPESDGRGHALLASAVAYCLGYELRAGGAAVDPTLLRLAALAHDLDLPAETRALLPAPVPRWLANRDLFFDALPGSPFPLHHFSSPAERALYAAHLVAAFPLPVAPNLPAPAAFREHPLARGEPLASLALVYGGATRIKGYVFETPRLPEIRGASGLLDRVNRLDLPALFGEPLVDGAEAAAAAMRDWFAARSGGVRLDAPECVIYAGGGNLLALAPASLADALRDAIEAWYAEQTLVAQSVAVARPTELVELQYGRQPTRYWWQEYAAVQSDEALRALIGHHGAAAAPSPIDPPPGKGFGELTTELVLLAARQRDERAVYPSWETPPYARRCASCDHRPASTQGPRGELLCPPCATRRQAGDALKRGEGRGLRSWIDRFVAYLEGEGASAPYARERPAAGWATVASPQDLDDIAATSTPRDYLGVIYADGDAMGAQLEALRTPAAYGAFSQQLAAATEGAVYAALARHLRPFRRPDGSLQHPFEVLNVGGDDVLLLVPGSVALAVAATIGRHFEAQFPAEAAEGADPWAAHRYRPPNDRQGRAVRPPRPARRSISGGVVIAPAATPMSLLRELSEDLLKSAKRARQEAGTAEAREWGRQGGAGEPPQRGWVDFLVIKGVGLPATSLEDWRRGRPAAAAGREPTGRGRSQRAGGAREPRLGAAPYTWPELEGLLVTARALRESELPGAQLHAVRDLLAHGEAAASVDYLYYRTHLAAEHRAQVEAHFEQAWRGPEGADATPVAPPWRGAERRETILPDLLAVYDFCADRLDAGGGDGAR